MTDESPSLGAPQDRPERKQDEMPDELARSGTTEIRDPQPAAVTDAGAPQESEPMKTRHGGNVGTTPFYLFPYQCEPEYDQGHWVVVWYDDLYDLAHPRPTAPAAHQERTELMMAEAAAMLWEVLANVSGGDWTQQSPEWQEAARRWRDYYFEAVRREATADLLASLVGDASVAQGIARRVSTSEMEVQVLPDAPQAGAPARAAEWQPIEELIATWRELATDLDRDAYRDDMDGESRAYSGGKCHAFRYCAIRLGQLLPPVRANALHETRSTDGDVLPIAKGPGDERAMPLARGEGVASAFTPPQAHVHARGGADRNDASLLKPAAGSEPAESLPVEWQSIESAPFGTDILVYFPELSAEYRVMVCHRFDEAPTDWYQQDADNCPDAVEDAATHWMPLPLPPGALAG